MIKIFFFFWGGGVNNNTNFWFFRRSRFIGMHISAYAVTGSILEESARFVSEDGVGGPWYKPAINYQNRPSDSVTTLIMDTKNTIFDTPTRGRASPGGASSLGVR